MRLHAGAALIALLGILLVWLGFAGRAGVVGGAILCPAQLVEGTPGQDPNVKAVRTQAVQAAQADNKQKVSAAGSNNIQQDIAAVMAALGF